ncbi:MAG: ornithine cyclodeaminase family protein [Alphaproteobacteria bacterium]
MATERNESRSVPYLSRAALEALPIDPGDVIARIEQLLRAQRRERAWAAPKALILPPDGRYMMATLSAADDPPFLAVKSLVMNPLNRERGLDDINALVTLLDSVTGLPLAVMDGNWVTAVRTAGLSATAARRLARADSSILALIGCGVQARSHLAAMRALFPIAEVRAFGRGAANREALCRVVENAGLKAVGCTEAEDAVQGADIVVTTVTFSATLKPFLDAQWLKSGAFAAITEDLAVPWRPESLTAFDRIIVGDLDQDARSDRPLIDPALVRGDLTTLVNDESQGRLSAEERTAFAFRGLAIGDLALAGLAYEKAVGGARLA